MGSSILDRAGRLFVDEVRNINGHHFLHLHFNNTDNLSTEPIFESPQTSIDDNVGLPVLYFPRNKEEGVLVGVVSGANYLPETDTIQYQFLMYEPFEELIQSIRDKYIVSGNLRTVNELNMVKTTQLHLLHFD